MRITSLRQRDENQQQEKCRRHSSLSAAVLTTIYRRETVNSSTSAPPCGTEGVALNNPRTVRVTHPPNLTSALPPRPNLKHRTGQYVQQNNTRLFVILGLGHLYNSQCKTTVVFPSGVWTRLGRSSLTWPSPVLSLALSSLGMLFCIQASLTSSYRNDIKVVRRVF